MVSGNEVHLGARGSFPARYRGIARTKVVVLIPSLVLFLCVSVKTIDSDQVPQLVTIVDK
jgi:hypothetical protein